MFLSCMSLSAIFDTSLYIDREDGERWRVGKEEGVRREK